MVAATVQSKASQNHFFALVWLLVMTVASFALYVAWDQGLLARIVAVDRSYVSSVVALLFVTMSVHAGWHVIRCSNRIGVAESLLNQGGIDGAALAAISREAEQSGPSGLADSPTKFLSTYIQEVGVARHASAPSDDDTSIVEIYADALRSPVELGWYVVDLAIRMGLIGTIIGFILIFSSLTGNKIPGVDEMQALLISMSSGMGTALYTTLCGLVCATILGFQYMILGRETEHLIGLLIRIRNLRPNTIRPG